MTLTLRASSLPLLAKCSGSLSLDTGAYRVDPWNDAAAAGTAVHAALAELVMTGDIADPHQHLRDACVPEELWDECRMLIAFGRQQWSAHAHNYPISDTETKLEYEGSGVRLTGHIDVMAIIARHALIQDWKTGRVDEDFWHQLRAYAFLVVADQPEVQKVTATVVRLREREMETMEWTADDLWRWWTETVVGRIAAQTGTLSPGEHCEHCPAASACPARQSMVRHAVSELTTTDGIDRLLEQINDHDLRRTPMVGLTVGGLYRSLGMVEKACQTVRDAIRASVTAHGPLPLHDGTQIAADVSKRDQLVPLPAWDVLREYASEEELAPAVRLSKGKAMEAVRKNAPPRMKSKTEERAMEALREANAVTQTEVVSLRIEKITQPQEQAV